MSSAATASPADTIRTALQGAMVGAWGRENALRALAEMEAEIERLRDVLEPFAAFGHLAVADDEPAWVSVPGEQLQRITTWFGPSDFFAARAAVRTEVESSG